jgi:hypothetical protein
MKSSCEYDGKNIYVPSVWRLSQGLTVRFANLNGVLRKVTHTPGYIKNIHTRQHYNHILTVTVSIRPTHRNIQANGISQPTPLDGQPTFKANGT